MFCCSYQKESCYLLCTCVLHIFLNLIITMALLGVRVIIIFIFDMWKLQLGWFNQAVLGHKTKRCQRSDLQLDLSYCQVHASCQCHLSKRMKRVILSGNSLIALHLFNFPVNNSTSLQNPLLSLPLKREKKPGYKLGVIFPLHIVLKYLEMFFKPKSFQ